MDPAVTVYRNTPMEEPVRNSGGLEKRHMKRAIICGLSVMIVLLAAVVMGCTGTSGTSSGSPASAAGGSPLVSGNTILPAVPYSWYAYKEFFPGENATINFIVKKDGTCTMWLEGPGVPVESHDCDWSGWGSWKQMDFNDVKNDKNIRFRSLGTEPVTVPAGTFRNATKYTREDLASPVTYWVSPDVPAFLRITFASTNLTAELSGWG